MRLWKFFVCLLPVLLFVSGAFAQNNTIPTVPKNSPSVSYIHGTGVDGTYDANTQVLSMFGTASYFYFPAKTLFCNPNTNTKCPAPALSVAIQVDSNGNLVGGNPVTSLPDLAVTGQVTYGGVTYTSPLLTGTVTQFFYDGVNNTSNFSLRFAVTGGSMASLYLNPPSLNNDLWMSLKIETVAGTPNFMGSFASSWGGEIKGTIYSTPGKCFGTIGDFVWNDQNSNGIQDAGEPGLNGVSVNLYDYQGNLLQSSVTHAGPTGSQLGYYQFTGVCAGTYTVKVDETTLPKGANGKIDFAETTPNASGSTTADDSNPNPSTVTLAHNGSTDATIDFGYVSLQGAIGDYVWFDANGNGLQDAGEPGINGVVVDLYDSTQTKLLATTTTAYGGPNNVNGFYQFTGLSAGNYVVAVDATTLPVNYTPTISSAGSNPAIDSDGSPAAVNLPTDSSTDATIDFGYVAPCNGAIGDFVWHDLNQNGVQDADEPGISGVKLYLYSSTHTLIQTAITNRVGYYQFSGVCEGTYEVDVDASTLPPSFTPTVSQALGSTTASDSNGSPAPVVLTLDSSNNVVSDQTIDFGYISPCNGAIGDFVWIDANGNGIQDGSEPGIADVTVSLYNLQMTLLNAATTNQNGYYQFTGLCAGKYIVQVTPPQDDIATIVNAAGSTTANDSNPSPSTVVLSIIDSNGDITNDETIDFGFVPQTPSLSCSSVTSGEVGVLFNSGAMTVSGGTAPYTFSVVGTLPAGLSLNASTGAVTGTPTAAGSFSIKVTDKNGVGATSTCLITITAGPSLSCSAVNSGEVGVLFNSGAMTVSGGTAPYTFSVVGTLPAGLALSTSTGAVTGTPSAAGTFSVRVTDAKGSMATSTCPITIAPLESASCALGLTSAYNIITLSGGISDSVDITGRIAASGQISGITTIGSWLSTKDPYITLASANGGPYAVVAGGGIASSVSVNINGGGNVYSSTATSASIGLANENYTGSAYANSKLVTGGTSPINFATVKAEMVSLSSQLAALPANGVTCLVDNFGKLISGNGCPTSTKTYNPSWVILYGSNATVNIFNVTQDQFQNDQLDIQVPTGSTAILNVSGTSDTLKYNILNQDVTVTDSNAPSILFNFPSATTVTINAQFDATLLAPKAYLSGSNQMGGTFISASMSQSNEVHYDPFTGMLQVTGACIQ